MRSWGKGAVWINGHNLGRYWEKGPQQTIYVPSEWLKKGKNEIMIFELIKSDQNKLHSLERPILDMLKAGQ
jgi:beta-galactosidase